MAPRRALKTAEEKPRGNYFTSKKENIEFIPTGSKLLDLSLGGGWAERRVANVIGDKSTGKTLLCIESCTNFARKYRARNQKFKIKYREFEHAFDNEYAEAVGAPIDEIDFNDSMETVEEVHKDLQSIAGKANGDPILYIIDSMDAVSSRAELDREIDEDSYGTEKARMLSQMFRRSIGTWAKANITIIIVSQIRDNIGAGMFAKKTKRTGGKALDFYTSQIITLAQIELLQKTVRGIKRPSGIKVKASCDKNKIGLAHRHTEFNIMFGYGVDDVEPCLEYIAAAGAEPRDRDALAAMGWNGKKEGISKLRPVLAKLDDKEYWRNVNTIHRITEKLWYDVERDFIPKRRKYTE